MDPTCCNNLPKSTYDNELLLYLANVLRIFLLYLCHLHPDGEIARRSPQTLRILPLHYLLPTIRDSIVKFFNNFHSYPPIETSSDYQDINTTYQYYVSTTVLTLFYQCSITQQHMSSICCIILPRQKKKSRGESKQRKEKYWRGRPPILSKKGKFCRQIWGKILDNFG